MGLRLRTSYILLAVSIVILAIGIILINDSFTALRPPATPLITVVANETLLVPLGVEDAAEIRALQDIRHLTDEIDTAGV